MAKYSPPTRFTNTGVTNQVSDDPVGQIGQLDPTKHITFFSDFFGHEFDVGAAGTPWTETIVQAGAGSATTAISDADGGILLITNDDADNDSVFIQWGKEIIKFESNKKLAFKARFKVSDATQSDFVMGLQITDTSPLDVTDGVFFQKDDGDANLDFHVEKNNTATTSAGVHTMVDDTYVVVGFYYDGDSEVQAFVDGTKVATLATTNLPDDEELNISFGIQNGEAASKTMSVDYIYAVKER